jgi:predicted acyltransferase (DUF342 family)
MATLYFNNTIDSDWSELGNWWTDSNYTVAATGLPSSGDDVIIGVDSSLSNSNPSSVTMENDAVTIDGTVTLNDSSFMLGVSITDAILNDNSFIEYVTVNGLVTFNDLSYNKTDITGTVTVNRNVVGINNSSILGLP